MKQYKMDSLYNIFQREKSRVGNEFTLFYSKPKNSLQYKDNVGTLTVVFDPKNGCEKIYYRNEADKGVGLGNLVTTITQHGYLAVLEDAFWDLPDNFTRITRDYQFNRDAIGVEITKEHIKSKNYYERD